MDQGPGSPLYLRGRCCMAAADGQELPTPHALLHSVRNGYVPARHLTDFEDDVAAGAGPRIGTAGVTPASVRTRSRRTEARQTAGVLCTAAVANDHQQSREHAFDTPAGTHEDPLPAAGGPPRGSDGGTVLEYGTSGVIRWCLRGTPKIHCSSHRAGPKTPNAHLEAVTTLLRARSPVQRRSGLAASSER